MSFRSLSVYLLPRHRWVYSLLGLLVCLYIGGIYSVTRGQDMWWDMLNYHLYNGFAFVTGRTNDLLAAGVHTFLNPLLDALYYLQFKYFFYHPKLMAFVMGLPYGLAIWCTYQITKEIWDGHFKYYWALLTTVLAVTSAGIFSVAGFCTQDIPVTVLLLLGFWLFVRFIRNPRRLAFIYIAAFIYGIAVGLKLTAAPFAVALFAAALEPAFRSKKAWHMLLCFMLCGIVGFLITNGYFMWKNWQAWGNPLFPYYNQIFKSSYYAPALVTEYRFLPRDIWQLLFYPFYWAFVPVEKMVVEFELRDMRLALWYISVFMGVWALARRKELPVSRCLFISLLLFTIVGYIAWLFNFSILRYACMLEITACMVIMIVLASLISTTWKQVVCGSCLVGLIIYLTVLPSWSVGVFEQQLLTLTPQPYVEDNALVFLTQYPLSYLVPLINPKASYMSGFNHWATDYPRQYGVWEVPVRDEPIRPAYRRFRVEQLQRDKILQHNGPIYFLGVGWHMNLNPKTLARFDLYPAQFPVCQFFSSSLAPYMHTHFLCRVQKYPLEGEFYALN